jgi:hypothetical protein
MQPNKTTKHTQGAHCYDGETSVRFKKTEQTKQVLIHDGDYDDDDDDDDDDDNCIFENPYCTLLWADDGGNSITIASDEHFIMKRDKISTPLGTTKYCTIAT